MSTTTPYREYFRRRTIGRAASPPTWACYEQIPYDEDDYSDSGSESCSEDDEDYSRAAAVGHGGGPSDSEDDVVPPPRPADNNNADNGHDIDNMDMDIDEQEHQDDAEKKAAMVSQTDIKGKQRAMEPEPDPEPPKRSHRRRQRRSMYTLRPILTIQRSQGFVWNQDLFIPPYIKDRYVASTSPPNSGFMPSSVSSTHSALNDYEVEVVEIRVQEGELQRIIP
ncbi:hypothetical protein K435DRAFT_677427 [Dendrothele bispora CBS 962.96]|uniref:Uncharacterized protein n=1 Tax=Dendrothele bispora (strain CBS 962.96) TaxID=1314807 RepID=A0A4S8LL15_DENBC|nr:hypothetical protein K435DRAFT_677427 [Dendrothele bispora CBS 962.96]